MNKTAIKNFAVWARRKLREEMIIRAGFLGITEKEILKPLAASTKDIQYFEIGAGKPVSIREHEIEQRNILVKKLSEAAEQTDYRRAYESLIEKMAFDWFNRLIAIRYMELNAYAPLDIRLLSSVEEGKQDPDLVSDPFQSDLEFSDMERRLIMEWKCQNKNDKLFRFLLVRMCNELHRILPGIFEDKGDVTEIFMRLSFIDKDGVIYHLTHDIAEEDWKDQVQIIGWIYQYYNTELKDETFALLKKNVKITKERIPSATQLFTPDWIVRYMVENSLGRLWVEGHPDEDLKNGWKYYLEDAAQEPEMEAQLAEIRKEYAALEPADIRCIDPCMGSGHILVYLFDVLMQIYESVGYSRKEAVRSVIENNLYGLDIDDRAYQLAYFAVMMKARQYDRGFLTRERMDGTPDIPAPHVYGIQESNGIRREQLKYFGKNLDKAEKETALEQAEILLDRLFDAKEYGSILNIEPLDWALLHRFAGQTMDAGQMDLEMIGLDETQERLQQLIDVGEVLAEKYHVVGTNPPYMGLSSGNANLNGFVKKNYPDSKTDLFAVFIERCRNMAQLNGYQAMITQHAWMFLSSFEKLREKLQHINIVNMVHLGARAFEEISGEVVQTTSFVFRNSCILNYQGTYCRLIDQNTQKGKEDGFLMGENRYISKQKDFTKIPGAPVAYWVSNKFIKIFDNPNTVANYGRPLQGTITGDNNRFLRIWFEVEFNNIRFDCVGEKNTNTVKWYPHNKGGGYRKWYGNHDYIINWKNSGHEIKNFYDKYGKLRSRPQNIQFFFKEGITWTDLTMGNFSARYVGKGFTFNVTGPTFVPIESKYIYEILAYFNSKVFQNILDICCPGLHYHNGIIAILPIVLENGHLEEISRLCVDVVKTDWDSFENSWEFDRHPLARYRTTIANNFSIWSNDCNKRFIELKTNEEELNRIFIDIYGLQDELSPEVEDKDITIRKADLQRDIKSLISYAVGCMFGRYSLDVEGLVFAGGEWDNSKYSSFIPEVDNCIPITDKRYFENDVVSLFERWLAAVYGRDTLEQNLNFVAGALGNKGSSTREIIRNYFLNDFFKDHCATYSVTGSGKRPIYWLFDSGKQNGFKALIYIHRYDEDTIGRVLIYLQKLQNKYETEIRAIDTMLEHITNQRQAAAEEKRRERLRKQIEEIKEYDERLEHMANERIHIDLDDGVKVNYEKAQTDRQGKRYQILASIK